MQRTAKILIVDDESPIREVLSASLKDEGHVVFTASDGESGIRAMKEHQPEIVFLDIWMPGSLDGIEVLTTARKQFPQIEFVMISGHGTIETAVKATKLGAWDFIEKPLSMDKISIVISNIVQYQQEREEKTALLNRLRRSIALLGEAPKMVALKQMIARAAPQQSWILLLGENGAGKELVAQNIHYMSSRASRPFIEINCSSIPEDLVDVELFGYERGAFAGADKTQKGKLELAQGGTVFLDDIADLSLKAQEKLLRILQEKKLQRLGGTSWIEVDIRLIAATKKDMEKEVQSDRFREDLYHRINVVTFNVPSLKEHPEDIPVLAEHFSDHAAKEGGFVKKTFSPQAMQLMTAHTWPGNVRELKNFIERVYILTPDETIEVPDLRFAGLASTLGNGANNSDLPSFRDARAQFEKEYLLKKIQENNGNISRTAEVIGLERSYLHRKIKAFGIEVLKGGDDQI
ncbi:MAG: Fis family transcriptional regulator [Bdellovibrio sp. CG10_big_fil_rev_8_21_14_0_10_47_8]|nr:MAG: Fis family transcriptional regulator [Bdellovibrio sp. CG10_big_fil_rev_8_21_14_0_10_47_8]